jgi:hypothetical protein
VHVRSRKEEEEEMLIVWTWDEVITLIHTRELTNHIKSMQLMVPRKKLTLVVYGAREYFRSDLSLHIKSVWHAVYTVIMQDLKFSQWQ